MRFILKAAFWLGLIAFLIPGTGHNATSINLSIFGAYAGAQQAIEDLTGFCGRAPKACEAGHELAVFAGERIGDGIAMAYDLIDRRRTPAPDVAIAPSTADPVTTGALEPHVRHAPTPVPLPLPRP